MIEKQLTISNKYGLHARASAKLVNLARRYLSKIQLMDERNKADCKSIMALMTLGAAQGSALKLVISGTDEEAAMEAIAALIENKFGED